MRHIYGKITYRYFKNTMLQFRDYKLFEKWKLDVTLSHIRRRVSTLISKMHAENLRQNQHPALWIYIMSEAWSCIFEVNSVVQEANSLSVVKTGDLPKEILNTIIKKTINLPFRVCCLHLCSPKIDQIKHQDSHFTGQDKVGT